MAEDRDNSIDIDVEQVTNEDPTEIGYQGSDKTQQEPSVDEFKQQAGELFKAAGGLAGSLGRLAVKKGTQLKEKIEDEEFQEKVSANIKAVTDKIDDYVSSDSYKGKKVVVAKGPITVPQENNIQSTAEKPKIKAVQNNPEIETDFEVEGNETVNFETSKPPKGIKGAIEKNKAERKAEKERKQAEKERKRKEDQKKSLIYGGLLMLLAVFCMMMANFSKGSHEGQIKAPLSSHDADGLNYEEVIGEFEKAGFTDVTAMKMEDLVVGWLESDGAVEKITIEGEEDYSTSSWFDPEAKVLVYYHTYPEQAEEEVIEEDTTQEKQEEPAEPDEQEGRIDEMAFRSAVVAITNATAPDVYDDNDGNSHDSSKYHSYADKSGEGVLSVISDGYWKETGDNKWHVDSLMLKNKYGVLYDASLDVEYTGSIYSISNIEGTWGKSGQMTNNLTLLTDPQYINNDTALEVPESLISKDR